MKTLLALIMIAFGALSWVGQLISAVRFPLAQRWGLQEGDRETDPLFRRDSLHATPTPTTMLNKTAMEEKTRLFLIAFKVMS